MMNMSTDPPHEPHAAGHVATTEVASRGPALYQVNPEPRDDSNACMLCTV